MIDISDGMLGDFTRISEESRVGGIIRLEEIPVVPGTAPGEALVSGEEFELLFTIPASQAGAARRSGCFVVGEVLPAGRGVRVTANGRPYRPRHPGYDHFRK
ncbi:MAG: thiamine monophosphate kinase [candidate division TA06 bacterium ADurb.Bin417]|uniref:Thiamine monophosphate kinase n=1 Tax=candidate division TA06 bacterium ADurb.Bin417 TaxID=1852828 RepID=A0A1V5M964_UNCT6|nr:MAG: thiamine monophosphate kinase [candidate division TA06 bacterium ADurb.Bin417]